MFLARSQGKGLVGFVDHICNVGVPAPVFGNGDSQVLNLPSVVELVLTQEGISLPGNLYFVGSRSCLGGMTSVTSALAV